MTLPIAAKHNARGMNSAAHIVSFDDEPLILVDGDDQPVGQASKTDCHAGGGLLHRAFSVFLFDDAGRMLIQQRGADKRLWPKFWSNACCSHPRVGEQLDDAVARRLREELGTTATLRHVFAFEYRARYGNVGSEHELCHVYLGRFHDALTPNATEIAATKVIEVDAFEAHLRAEPERYTPWFKLEWERIRAEHWPSVARLLPP